MFPNCFSVPGPDMMMHDDFSNEDVGNIIMDADYTNNTPLDYEYDTDIASFRSFRNQGRLRGNGMRKRKRNRNRPGNPRNRQGTQTYFYIYIDCVIINIDENI